MASRSKNSTLALAAALTLGAVLAWAWPEYLLAWGPPCLFSTLFDVDCWGCGITRALLALLHGDLVGAWHLHRGVVLVAPLLVVEYLRLWRPIVFSIWRGRGRATMSGASPPINPRTP